MGTFKSNARVREAKKKKFLEAFAKTGIVTPALKTAKIGGRSTLSRWLLDDENFRTLYKEAAEEAADTIELELRTRAIQGLDEVVMYRGEPVWRRNADGQVQLDENFNPIPLTVSRKSDRLLEAHIKAHNVRYRDKTDITLMGAGGGPVKGALTVTFVKALGNGSEGKDEDDKVEDNKIAGNVIDLEADEWDEVLA